MTHTTQNSNLLPVVVDSTPISRRGTLRAAIRRASKRLSMHVGISAPKALVSFVQGRY